jgi:opacity protein-like surface antigen
MNTIMTKAAVFLVTLLVGSGSAYAQQAAAPADQPTPGFDVHGSFDVGYRFTDIEGYEPAYRQMFNLSDGPRLMSLELRGDSRTGGEFANHFTVTASGFGDPFSGVQVTVKKSRLYDLRLGWRRSLYFSVPPLTPASMDGLDTRAVTDFHSWDTSRQIGNAALTLTATNRLHLLFSYDRVARDGVLQPTRAIDFIGSPSTWGAFARANPYLMRSPVDDSSHRIGGGASFAGDRWSVHYKAGYQTQEVTQTLDPAASPERSINVGDAATANELLVAFGSTENRRLKSPFSELSYVLRPSARFEWRGQYLFSRYEGPFSIDAAVQGTARTNNAGTTLSPYDVAISARGDLTAPSHVVTQGLTFRPFDRWAFDVAYRFARFSSEATGDLSSLLALYPPATSTPQLTTEREEVEWRHATHSVEVTATFEPNRVLIIRPGVTMMHRDVVHRQDGVELSATSDTEKTISPLLLVGYRPSRYFSARGSWSIAHNDTSYTRLSPVDRTNGRLMVRVEPLTGLTVEGTASLNDAELPDAAYVSHLRFGSVQASYSWSERLTVLGGIDYQSFLGLGNVTFLRGTAPIANDEMRDRETDRIWLFGAIVKPVDRLSVTATMNFDRTEGTDSIVGEPPLYGPLTFRYGTGTISYDIPQVGRVSVDLQRTRMAQELLPMNNFRGSLLTLRYSRSF